MPFVGFYLLVTPGVTFWVLTFFTGFLAGCGSVVQPAIQADVIDYDELTTHDRKEGAYLAVWNLVRKCSSSLCALLPAASYLIGGLLFARFAFNEAEHLAARRVIDERA
ncbi:MAG: MFS transporter [Proteobacteria bacterium]|nr:MFS transporter [Pseudomonadota bacterium]